LKIASWQNIVLNNFPKEIGSFIYYQLPLLPPPPKLPPPPEKPPPLDLLPLCELLEKDELPPPEDPWIILLLHQGTRGKMILRMGTPTTYIASSIRPSC
jgi:hypothetical protein